MPRLLASDISDRVLPNAAKGPMRELVTTIWRQSKKITRISRLIAITAIGFLLSGQPVEAQIGGLDLESPIVPAGPPVLEQQYAQPQLNAMPIGSSVDFQSGTANGVAQTNFIGCTSCGSVGCHGCDDVGPGYSCPPGLGLWIRADYLIWYEKNMDTIPLVTTSSGIPNDPDTLLDIDAAETSVLFGGRGLADDPLNGWRLEVGTWLNADATLGIFGRYFNVGDRSFGFSDNSGRFRFLGVPFFNGDANREESLDLRIPNERTGNVNVQIDGGLRNFEILCRRLAETGSNYRLDWVYGYRNLRLHEDLTVNLASQFDTTTIASFDSFKVKDQFHGFDFGVMGQSHQGCWSMDFLLKVALGVMDQELTIDGRQFNTVGQNIANNVGGVFAQETNIGRHDNNEFAVVPEFNINLGYAITPNIDLTVGYTFLYASNVVRAGSALDRNLDQGLFGDLNPVNSTRPQVNFDSTSYYIHGLNLGLTARF